MIGLDPTATYECTLSPYANDPPATRPTFILRHMTCRERSRYWAAIRATEQPEVSEGAAVVSAIEAMRTVVTGWRNVLAADGSSLRFDIALLPEVLTIREFNELVLTVWNGAQLDLDSKKNSA